MIHLGSLLASVILAAAALRPPDVAARAEHVDCVRAILRAEMLSTMRGMR